MRRTVLRWFAARHGRSGGDAAAHSITASWREDDVAEASASSHVISALEHNIQLLSDDCDDCDGGGVSTTLSPFKTHRVLRGSVAARSGGTFSSAGAADATTELITPVEAIRIISAAYEPHLYAFGLFSAADIAFALLTAGLLVEPVESCLERWLRNPHVALSDGRAFEASFGAERAAAAASVLRTMLHEYDTTAATVPKALDRMQLDAASWLPFLRGLTSRGVYNAQLAPLVPLALQYLIAGGLFSGEVEQRPAASESMEHAHVPRLAGELEVDRVASLSELLLAASAEFGCATVSSTAFDLMRRYRVPTTLRLMRLEAKASATTARRLDDFLLRCNGQLHVSAARWINSYFPTVLRDRAAAAAAVRAVAAEARAGRGEDAAPAHTAAVSSAAALDDVAATAASELLLAGPADATQPTTGTSPAARPASHGNSTGGGVPPAPLSPLAEAIERQAAREHFAILGGAAGADGDSDVLDFVRSRAMNRRRISRKLRKPGSVASKKKHPRRARESRRSGAQTPMAKEIAER